MIYNNRSKQIILFWGDITIFYFSLFISLAIRYKSFPSYDIWKIHLLSFSVINILWVVIFYITEMYNINKLTLTSSLTQAIKVMAICFIVAVFLFYFIPSLKISPKINLLINAAIISFLIWIWRKLFLTMAAKGLKIKIFFLGNFKEINEIKQIIEKHPHLGYEITEEISSASVIIIDDDSKNNKEAIQSLYKATLSGKTIVNFINFYESLTGKFPISMIEKIWFLENTTHQHRLYELIKKILEPIWALIIFIVIFPFLIIIFFLIKITSEEPAIFKQKRIGKKESEYIHYKFRTMINNPPVVTSQKGEWITKNDARVTKIGHILRLTRIDELPQLFNIIKGDISFIGPRPDFIEFYKILKREIPYYNVRSIIKPGLTGWAQVNNKFGGSPEQAKERLAYEIYYLKNHSPFLDLLILLRTIKTVITASGI